MLIDLLSPKLVLCGHMHYRYQTNIITDGNKQTEVYCLADIQQGDAAIAIFRAKADGEIEKVFT